MYQTSDCGVDLDPAQLAGHLRQRDLPGPLPRLPDGRVRAAAPDGEFEESVAFWETSDAGAEWSAVTRVPPLKGPGPIALPEGCLALGTGWSTLSTGWIFGACLVSNPQPDMGTPPFS